MISKLKMSETSIFRSEVAPCLESSRTLLESKIFWNPFSSKKRNGIRQIKIFVQTNIQYEQKLYDKILDKFMTQEEKELFNKIIKSGNIVFMGNPNSIGQSSMPMLGL